jgi:C_GCAxxG_C_C family probable redox protein
MKRRDFLTRSAGVAAGFSLIAVPGVFAGTGQAGPAEPGEDIRRELEDRAKKFMMKYGTCSQSSFAALNEQFGLGGDSAVPALMPFAGGLAGNGETCGAVSGAMLALGFFFESAHPEARKPGVLPFQYGKDFFDRFSREFSSTRCREVVKHQYGRYYDFMNPEDMKLFAAESQKSGKCLDVVKRAVRIAAAIMQEAGKKPS